MTEAPRLHAQPSEVLDRVAEVGELPVEHGADAFRADDEVAVPEVAVHEASARRARGGMRAESHRSPSSKVGCGSSKLVEQVPVLRESAAPRPGAAAAAAP